jgi:hypothetical protein
MTNNSSENNDHNQNNMTEQRHEAKGKKLFLRHLMPRGWGWKTSVGGRVLVAPRVPKKDQKLGVNAFRSYSDLYQQYKKDGRTMIQITGRAGDLHPPKKKTTSSSSKLASKLDNIDKSSSSHQTDSQFTASTSSFSSTSTCRRRRSIQQRLEEIEMEARGCFSAREPSIRRLQRIEEDFGIAAEPGKPVLRRLESIEKVLGLPVGSGGEEEEEEEELLN